MYAQYYRTVPDAIRAHEADIEIYTIGVTSLVNETEVKLMSSLPQIENETYWLLPDFQVIRVEIIQSKLLLLFEVFHMVIH